MKYHVLTLFPEMLEQALHTSVIGRAMERGILTLETVDIRDYADNKHHKVDDYPYGGGAGMVMQAEPVYRACRAVRERTEGNPRVIYVTPQGRVFDQKLAGELAREEDLIFLCGHYEGIDERVLEEVVTDYVSIGDYVLTGGELAAMVMIDAVSRLVPGVLSNEESAQFESFQDGLLEYPQYSRPETWRSQTVPQVLLCGDHNRIEDWRRERSVWRTRERRPDLYEAYKRDFGQMQARETDAAASKTAGSRKRRLRAVFLDPEVLREGEAFRPWAEKLLLLTEELGLKAVYISGKDFGCVSEHMKKNGWSAREILVLASGEETVRMARTGKLRTLYLPFGQEEPEGLVYYRKLFDLVEAMAVIRKLA